MALVSGRHLHQPASRICGRTPRLIPVPRSEKRSTTTEMRFSLGICLKNFFEINRHFQKTRSCSRYYSPADHVLCGLGIGMVIGMVIW